MKTLTPPRRELKLSPNTVRNCIKLCLLILLPVFAKSSCFGNSKTNAGNHVNHIYVDPSVQSLPLEQLRHTAATLQLFTHGKPGELFIEGQWKEQKAIVAWVKKKYSLSSYTHINIYGCQFAKGQKGLAAVKYLQQQLAISVAASTNITGKDGDWVLETGKAIDVLSFIAYAANLQSPGGVGTTNLKLWNKANTGVTTSGANVTAWADQTATNVFTVTGTPVLQTSALNYNPTILFNGSSRFTGNTSITSTTQAFAVGKIVNGTPVNASGALIGNSVNNGFQYFFHTEGGRLYSAGNVISIYTSYTSANSIPYSLLSEDLGKTPAASDMIRLNGENKNNASGSDPVFYSAIPTLGSRATENLLNGSELGEAIVFNTSLSAANTNKVESYLALKYGITLSNTGAGTNGDYTSSGGTIIWDADNVSSYHNNVIGIAKDSVASRLIQKQSQQSDDSTRIYIGTLAASNAANTGTFSSDLQFVMIGNNNAALSMGSTEYPSGNGISNRIGREWKITNTGFTGTFSLDIKTAIGALNGTLRILIDDDGDFSNATMYAPTITYSNNVVTISGISNTQIPAGSTKYLTVVSLAAPGGVSNGLYLWTKADVGLTQTSGQVTQWTNQASTAMTTQASKTASSNVTYNDSAFNYNPTVVFDGTISQRLAGTYAAAPTGIPIFFGATKKMGVKNNLSAVVSLGDAGNAGLQYNSTGDAYSIDGNGVTCSFTANIDSLSSVARATYKSTTLATNAFTTLNGTNSTASACASGGIGPTNGVFEIGGRTYAGQSSRIFAGNIAEVMHYNGATLSVTDTSKIESYLAIKYGITLTHNYLNSSATTVYNVATYGQRVIGIGRDDNSALLQKQSHDDKDSIRIYLSSLAAKNANNAGSFNSDNQFVLIGDNGGAYSNTGSTEYPAGISSRLTREWKVTNTNFDATFSIDIKTSNSCSTSGNELRLLVDDDGNFSNGGTTIYSAADGLTFTYTSSVISIHGITTAMIPTNGTRYITIAAVAVSSGTASASQTIAGGTAPAGLNLSGSTAVIKWQYSSNNFTSDINDIASSASATLTSGQMGTLTASRYYRAVTAGEFCAPVYSNIVTITVDTDGDGVQDGIDIDDDNDGVLDADEMTSATSTVSKTGVTVSIPATISYTYNGAGLAGLVDGSDNNAYVVSVPTGTLNNAPWLNVSFPTAKTLSSFEVGHYNGQTLFSTSSTYRIQAAHDALGTWTDVTGTLTYNNIATSTSGGLSTYNSNIGTINVTANSIAYKHYRLYGISGTSGGTWATELYFKALTYTDFDTDGDGIANRLDLDSDGDGCSDAKEAGATTSTAANFQFSGVVGTNGLKDSLETVADNGIINYTSTYINYAIYSALNACADTDNDGIRDLVDIDDDNDGVLDAAEQICSASTATPDDIPNAATSPESGKNSFTNGFYDGSLNKPGLNSSTSWSAPGASTSYYVGVKFAQASRISAINTQGRNGSAQWITSYKLEATKQTISNGSQGSSVTWIDLGTFTANTDYTSTVSNAISNTDNDWTAIRITPQAWSGHPSIRFSVTLCNVGELDTDGDGIVNRLDLDSDNDGCSDAKEAGATTSTTANYQFTGAVGTNGLINSKETVIDNGVINYTSTYNTYAVYSSLNLCADTDNDGVMDIIDIDDDNDGILDVNESGPCSSTPAYASKWNVTVYDYSAGGFTDCTLSNSLGTLTQYASGTMTSGTDLSLNWANGTTNTTLLASLTTGGGTLTGSNPPDITYAVYHEHTFTVSDAGIYTIAAGTIYDGKKIYKVLVNGTDSLIFCDNNFGTQNTAKEIRFEAGSKLKIIVYENGANNAQAVINITPKSGQQFYNNCSDIDTDNDGIPNRLDLDSDNDGCSDAYESGATISTTANYQFSAPYGTNGLADAKETATDNGITNYTSTYNKYAVYKFISICDNTDTDGVMDIIDIDDDNDGILDAVECPSCYYTSAEAGVVAKVSTGLASSTVNSIAVSTGADIITMHDGTSTTVAASNHVVAAAQTGTTSSVIYTLEYPTPIKLTSVSVIGATASWGTGSFAILEGSADGITFSDALSAPLATSAGTTKTWTVTLNTGNYYQYYRIRVSTVGSTTPTFTNYEVSAVQNTTGYIPSAHQKSVCSVDTDNDGITNNLDLDSDGDACPDAPEAGVVKTSGGPAMQSGVIQNGSGGNSTTQYTFNKAVVSGPYGANGFANSVEASAESGTYYESYNYAMATNGLPMVNCSSFGIVLEVKWLSVGALLKNEDGIVSWKVIEKSVKHYIIQRSVDGINFSNISTVNAASSSASQEKQYSYTDRQVTSLNVLTVFYRIVSVDVDGRSSVSSIIPVSIPRKEIVAPLVYPNPTTGIINFTSLTNVKAIEIYNTLGAKMKTILVSNSNQLRYDISGLSTGLYMIRLLIDAEPVHLKIELMR